MKWATRRHCHVDRAACAWLIRRFVDPEAEFVFVDDADEVPVDATPFDMRGVELSHHSGDCSFETFLRRYELPYNKIASAMLTHAELVEAVAEERKPTFVSTGMSSLEEIDRAVEVFRRHDCPFVLMHTVAEYPAPDSALNLRTLHELRERYGCPVGYSGFMIAYSIG